MRRRDDFVASNTTAHAEAKGASRAADQLMKEGAVVTNVGSGQGKTDLKIDQYILRRLLPSGVERRQYVPLLTARGDSHGSSSSNSVRVNQ